MNRDVLKRNRPDSRNRISTPLRWVVESSIVVMCLLLGVACGKVGPPIYPEDIGLAVKLEEHRAQQAAETDRPESEPAQDTSEEGNTRDTVPQEGEVVLPPLRPLGSQ